MSRPTPPTCKTTNWPAHNDSLKRRGSLTIWLDPEMHRDALPEFRGKTPVREHQRCPCATPVRSPDGHTSGVS